MSRGKGTIRVIGEPAKESKIGGVVLGFIGTSSSGDNLDRARLASGQSDCRHRVKTQLLRSLLSLGSADEINARSREQSSRVSDQSENSCARFEKSARLSGRLLKLKRKMPVEWSESDGPNRERSRQYQILKDE